MSDTATTNNFGVPVTKAGDYILRLKRELAAANERIAELERERDSPMTRCPQCDQLRLEIGALRKDATRYQYLRENHIPIEGDSCLKTGDELDAAIDAAMKEQR